MQEAEYFIRQGDSVQGPFPESQIRAWVAQGRARQDMEFAEPGQVWVSGHDLPHLFAPEGEPEAYRPERSVGRRSRGRAGRRSRGSHPDDGEEGFSYADRPTPPTPVVIASILIYLMGTLVGITGVLLLMMTHGLNVLMLALSVLVLAVAYFVLGTGVRKGAPTARNLVILITALFIAIRIKDLIETGNLVLVGAVLNGVVMIVLLVLPASAAYFKRASRPLRRSRRIR